MSDPLPGPRASAIARFRRIMIPMTAISLLMAIVAVALVALGDPGFHIHMLIATALGVFFTALLGTALMSLVFLSNSSGHDASAAASSKSDKEEPK